MLRKNVLLTGYFCVIRKGPRAAGRIPMMLLEKSVQSMVYPSKVKPGESVKKKLNEVFLINWIVVGRNDIYGD